MDTPERPLDPRRREAHPERIMVGGEVFIRNDIQAKQLGTSERSVNRGDQHGAPYRFFGGVKYRPEKLYAEFIINSIQTDKPSLHMYEDGRKRRA
jgi:hypothetical protein